MLKRVHWWVLQEVPDRPRGRGARPVPRRVQRPVRRVQGAARRGAGRTQEVRRDGRHDAHVAPATQQPDGDWMQPDSFLLFCSFSVCLFVCLSILKEVEFLFKFYLLFRSWIASTEFFRITRRRKMYVIYFSFVLNFLIQTISNEELLHGYGEMGC